MSSVSLWTLRTPSQAHEKCGEYLVKNAMLQSWGIIKSELRDVAKENLKKQDYRLENILIYVYVAALPL